MDECLFCSIIEKKTPSKTVHEDEICVAFHDMYPKARVHLLVVPRKHIPTIADMQEGDEKIVGHLVKTAKELAGKNNCLSYKLQFNVGKEAGQVIFHIHLHLLGN